MKGLEATITCPLCGTTAREAMPENACRHFYRCTGCDQTLRPKDGDCCVFCSYADAVCPPRMLAMADALPVESFTSGARIDLDRHAVTDYRR